MSSTGNPDNFGHDAETCESMGILTPELLVVRERGELRVWPGVLINLYPSPITWPIFVESKEPNRASSSRVWGAVESGRSALVSLQASVCTGHFNSLVRYTFC